jgi:hypothetical protein
VNTNAGMRVRAASDAGYLLLDKCANLSSCNESADSQAFPANAAEKWLTNLET